ncbi:MAG: hypothetical protein LBT46_00810 [Planctomycetaceae bacterium]|jgi:type II secretion system protein D|nr:hypothetical protein [Planctomycetaceae bacterium]
MKPLQIILFAAVVQCGFAPAETVSLTPHYLPMSQIEQTLRNVLNDKITLCQIRFDAQNNRIILDGSHNLCSQFSAFIQSVDQPAPSPGRERRFIKVQNTSPQVLVRAFESYRVPKQVNQNGNPSGTLPVPVRNQPNSLLPHPLLEYKPTDTRYNRRHPFNAVEQVQYQAESSGTNSGRPTSSAGNTLQGGSVQDGGGQNAQAVDIASDFRYQILPDLDVVVIDATGAEVARFTDMIRQIEALSKIAEPQIETVFLKNVNCISLNNVIAQIYVDIFKAAQGAVKVLPMIDPNAMLLIGWGQSLETMKKLIAELDQPVASADSRLKVFTLKHASAPHVIGVLRGTFPTPPLNSGFMPRVQMFSDTRTNSLIVQAAPNELKDIERIITEIDVSAASVKLQVKAFKLKHTLASDMVTVLTNAVASGTSGTADQKFPALELLVEDEHGKRLIESGILSDVKWSADVRNNTVIVTAPAESMDFIEELIAKIDAPAAAAEIKIFPVIHGDANAIVKALQALLPSQLDGQTGPQLPGAADEDNLIPVRFAVDARINCILAAGSPGDLKIVEALVLSLDREDQQSRKETVYELKSMKAADVALAINEYVQSRRTIQQASPGVISAYQQIESEVIIIPEPQSNTLIVSATPKYYDEIVSLIKEIDKSPPQVQIRVLIGEVDMTDTHEFGMEFGIQDSLLFNRSLPASVGGVTGALSPGFLFGDPSSGLPLGSVSPGNVGTQMLTNYGTGRIGSETGFGGMVFSASSESVSILIRALQENNKLEILSCPSITAMNNQPAVIHIGQNVPRYRGATISTTSTNVNVSDEKVGLMLQVTPNISPEGSIVMSVVATKSKVNRNANEAVNIGTSSDGKAVVSPPIDLITAATMISAANNETVVLGGLLTKENQARNRKVPLLGDIPMLGKLFRYDYTTCQKKELLIILTPRIIRDKKDMEEIKQMDVARMNWCLNNVSKIYGDIGTYNVIADKPYTGNAAVIKPDEMPALAPGIPAPVLPKKKE